MKIKILYTIPNFDTAGSGTALYKLLSIINRDEFEPEIACLHDRGKLFPKVKSLGFPVHVLQYTHTMRPILSGLAHCWKISNFFSKQKYDIVYSYHYHADYSEAIAAKLAGIKWVFVKKNMGWFGPNLRAWRLRSLLADSIVVQNTDMIKKFYPNSNKVSLISIGVDTEEFSPKPLSIDFKTHEGFNHDDIIILSVSSLLPIKGVDLILEAFTLIEKKHPKLKLIIIGDDNTDYAKSLKYISLQNDLLDNKIFFKGFQNNISNWLNISTIFIQATKNEGEGAPIALQEAMASGCLVLGSKVAGIVDQLNNFSQLLFEAGSKHELANRIEYLLTLDDNQKAALSTALVEEVNNRYSLYKEKEHHENLLKQLLRKKIKNIVKA